MVSIDELRKIYLLENLTDPMLEKVLPIIKPLQFKEKEVVFEEGEKAENLYMLKRGKVVLEVEISEMIVISLGSIKSGYSFGWSALLEGSTYTSYAVCAESCDVLATPGKKFVELLNEDPIMGYRVMDFTAKILKNRLERRTGQFLTVMSKHPDIQKLLGF